LSFILLVYHIPLLRKVSYKFSFIRITEHNAYQNQDEHRTNEPEDPFWQFDEAIGEGRFYGEPYTMRLKAHISEERYHRAEGDEIVPLQAKSGTRIDVLAKPYILIPDYTFTIGMYSQPTEQGAIGEVISSDWVGMKQQEIGQAQSWLYKEDRTLILWEAYLHDWCRKDDPRTDETLHTLWTGFEGFLLRQLSHHPIERIAVPGWEPLYDTDKEAWPQFLEGLGYDRISDKAFGRQVGGAPSNQDK
jgi:hypothetical protein